MTNKPDLSLCTFDELVEELIDRSDAIMLACRLTADTDDRERLRVAGDMLLWRGLHGILGEFAHEIEHSQRHPPQ